MRNIGGLRGELLRFLIVGGLAVAIDGALYFFFAHTGIFNTTWSKRVSFAVGALWAFIANKLFTFQRPRFAAHEPLLFGVVYLFGWLLNSLTHDLVFRLQPIGWLAFLIATAVSTVTNFVGQKWIVFRATPRPPSP